MLMQTGSRRPMVDMALQGGARAQPSAVPRAKVLARLRLTDASFRHLTRAAAIAVLIILGGTIVSLIQGSLPAFQAFGLNFHIGHSSVRKSAISSPSGTAISIAIELL